MEGFASQGAFFRLEGSLSPAPTWAAAAWLAANAQGVRERLSRLGRLALSVPFGEQSHLTWLGLSGVSEDRLFVIGREYARAWIIPKLRSPVVRLLAAAREQGREPVMFTEHLDVVAKPVAEALQIDHLICNRMEVREGKATGSLRPPVVGAGSALTPVTQYAEAHGLRLDRSAAYSSRQDDVLLLGRASHPCAVYPDRSLRRTARDSQWPIVEG